MLPTCVIFAPRDGLSLLTGPALFFQTFFDRHLTMIRTTPVSPLTSISCMLALASCTMPQAPSPARRTDEELRAIIDPRSEATTGARCSALNDLACSLARRGVELDYADRCFREADTLAKKLGNRAEAIRASITLNHIHLFISREDLPGLEQRCFEAYNEQTPQSLVKLSALAGLGRALQMRGERPAGALLTRLAYVGVYETCKPQDPLLKMMNLDVELVNRVLERHGESTLHGWPKLREHLLTLGEKTDHRIYPDLLRRVVQDYVKRPGTGDIGEVIRLEASLVSQESGRARAERYLTVTQAVSAAFPKNVPLDATSTRVTIDTLRGAGVEALKGSTFPGEQRQISLGLATLSFLLQDLPATRSYLLQTRALDQDEGYPVDRLDKWLAAIDALEAQRVGGRNQQQ